MRKLKYHEQKLLKKVNFSLWKGDPTVAENFLMNHYKIKKREDVLRYNQLAKRLRKLGILLTSLDENDNFRVEVTERLLNKLYRIGLIESKENLMPILKITGSCFCKRRLSVVLVRNRMASSYEEANNYILHGHVRVGPDCINDPAYLIPKSLEDLVTWVNDSKIKRTILKFNNQLDDYDVISGDN
eukprot:TRINITY_DN391_c2_g1_i1.p1 TRINITY_DN391_c2_g1~~TRINITY_DN391_c2_g1_i1.p1  ORF type:complete len:186 (-),score=63.55 TRINITY_DN391_c2_g1_i1:96-653(-)